MSNRNVKTPIIKMTPIVKKYGFLARRSAPVRKSVMASSQAYILRLWALLERQRDHHQKMKPRAVTDVTRDVTFMFSDVIFAILGL